MVDAVVTVFTEKLLNIIEKESGIIIGAKDQFENLKDELLYIKDYLKAGEKLKRKNGVLKRALAELRELIYEGEDMILDWEGQSTKLPLRYLTMGKKLEKMKETISSIQKRISVYVTPPLSSDSNMEEGESQGRSSQTYNHTQVVGLDSDTKKVKDWLFDADQCGVILAVGFVGMGGLGKTTLARKVFDDNEVELRFEKRIWVSVSQSLDEKRILTKILRTLGDVTLGDDSDELLKKINQFLSGKSFLIVLDDVWERDSSWWDPIYEGLPKDRKSCVIITTRNEEVARNMRVREDRIHRPKFLGMADSWLLFCNVVLVKIRDFRNSNELNKVGQEIVSRCGGLPLAIKAIGGIIGSKNPWYIEWKRISEDFRVALEGENKGENKNTVMASLQLSYDELPPDLKLCFLSLSIYPEDSVIATDQLVRWWIGEGFVKIVRKGKLSSAVSEDCFSRLINRCLVEVVDWDYNGKIETCKVHDMVRDLVIKIAEDEAFYDENFGNSRHFGINNDIEKNGILLPNKKLRAIVSTSRSGEVNKITSCVGKNFCEFQHLRVLDLSKSVFDVSLETLLTNIGDLKLLGCLNLSNTHPLTDLPSSLGKIDGVRVLDFSYCQSLKCLPSFVTNFSNLEVLDVSHCGSLGFFPKGLGLLSNLQVLIGFKAARTAEEGSRIADLRNLLKLRILELQITRADEIDDSETDTLCVLEQLQILTVDCYHSFENELVGKLEKLVPPKRLDELSLRFYPGKTSPGWLNAECLSTLRYLSISGGNLISMSEKFWETAWSIEGLKLDCVSRLGMEWETVKEAMPDLRTVHAFWCPELRGFPIDRIGFRGGVWKKEDHRNSDIYNTAMEQIQ